MNCPHCGMPEVQDTGDDKIWHKWECGNVILWPTDGSSKSSGAHTQACRQIATLEKRVRVLEEVMKRVVALSHFGGLLNSRTDDLMLSIRKATKEYVSLVSNEREKDLRSIALDGGKGEG